MYYQFGILAHQELRRPVYSSNTLNRLTFSRFLTVLPYIPSSSFPTLLADHYEQFLLIEI